MSVTLNRLPDLPPFAIIAATLRTTTETLAREITQPGDSAPEWDEFAWAIARAAAAMQGISAVLARTLNWTGPPSWREFLTHQSEEIARRDEKIGALLERIDTATRHHSIAVIALKGSALRGIRLWPFPERPMGDVDLLVRPHQLEKLACALTGIGYQHSYTSRRHVVFRPCDAPAASGFGERARNPIPIEVHTRITEALPASEVDITARLWPVQPTVGINHYASTAALLCHLLSHCAGNMRAHALRLSQLRDVAQLAARMTRADWQELLNGPACWWMYPPLHMSARYFPGSIPVIVLASARRHCPTVLRWAAERSLLTTVSWSNLRIDAFPGSNGHAHRWRRCVMPRAASCLARSRSPNSSPRRR